MFKSGSIITGLIVFLGLVTYPFWSQIGGSPGVLPQPELPENFDQCVESREYMRTNHMVMLHNWRDEVVRENDFIYTNSKGQKFEKSLTNTCMNCHDNREQFCGACHQAAGVDNYCWDCHNDKPEMGANRPAITPDGSMIPGHGEPGEMEGLKNAPALLQGKTPVRIPDSVNEKIKAVGADKEIQ